MSRPSKPGQTPQKSSPYPRKNPKGETTLEKIVRHNFDENDGVSVKSTARWESEGGRS